MSESVAKSELTRLWDRAREGDAAAEREFWTQAYDELTRTARRVLSRQAGGSLRTNDLVHDFFSWAKKAGALHAATDREHFYRRAARKMQWLMLDCGRRTRDRRDRLRRYANINLDPALQELVASHVQAFEAENGCTLHELHLALRRLRRRSRREYDVVRMRIFLGLDQAAIAEAIGCSKSTVERTWRLARARLYQDLRDTER